MLYCVVMLFNVFGIIMSDISQRKFLLQAEAAVETQLNDAQRQIAFVHQASVQCAFVQKGLRVLVISRHACGVFDTMSLKILDGSACSQVSYM